MIGRVVRAVCTSRHELVPRCGRVADDVWQQQPVIGGEECFRLLGSVVVDGGGPESRVWGFAGPQRQVPAGPAAPAAKGPQLAACSITHPLSLPFCGTTGAPRSPAPPRYIYVLQAPAGLGCKHPTCGRFPLSCSTRPAPKPLALYNKKACQLRGGVLPAATPVAPAPCPALRPMPHSGGRRKGPAWTFPEGVAACRTGHGLSGGRCCVRVAPHPGTTARCRSHLPWPK